MTKEEKTAYNQKKFIKDKAPQVYRILNAQINEQKYIWECVRLMEAYANQKKEVKQLPDEDIDR